MSIVIAPIILKFIASCLIVGHVIVLLLIFIVVTFENCFVGIRNVLQLHRFWDHSCIGFTVSLILNSGSKIIIGGGFHLPRFVVIILLLLGSA